MRAKWSSWINLLLGVWLVIAPFALSYSGLERRAGTGWSTATSRAGSNDTLVGGLVIILAAFAIVATADRWRGRLGAQRVRRWASWLIVTLGVWEIIAPFALGYSGTTDALANDILVGSGLVVFGLIAALTARAGLVATQRGYDDDSSLGYGLRHTQRVEEEQRRRAG
jgi:small-conductance mechanosensitive channel